MPEFIKIIFSNHILNTGVLAWFFAQTIKGIIASVQAKKILIDRFFGSGGMPSSHSSLVTSVLTMVFLICGVTSAEFAIAAVFWFVTTYDAANVRYAVGEQAKIINQIILIDERVEHPKGTLSYRAVAAYEGDEPVPRSVIVDMRSSDGLIDERVEREKLFKELMGHTKTEIFFGCLLGLAIALIYWTLFIH